MQISNKYLIDTTGLVHHILYLFQYLKNFGFFIILPIRAHLKNGLTKFRFSISISDSTELIKI